MTRRGQARRPRVDGARESPDAAESGQGWHLTEVALPAAPMIPERFVPLVDATADLAFRFEEAGHRLYVVGGSVRDAFVGNGVRPAQRDLDLTTDAAPDEVERIVADWADTVWLQGKRFGTVGVRKGPRRFEITTHRAEAYH